ncbi:MAG: hypothetical protein FWC49_01360, partial [Proteobacteria bacterium]|nr:hypothetical protein [Pseudomonadota bacterium]
GAAAAHAGALFFGHFLLGKQKKVPRPKGGKNSSGERRVTSAVVGMEYRSPCMLDSRLRGNDGIRKRHCEAPQALKQSRKKIQTGDRPLSASQNRFMLCMHYLPHLPEYRTIQRLVEPLFRDGFAWSPPPINPSITYLYPQ